MTGSMENPLLEDGTPTLALLNRTGVGGPTLRVPAAHGWAQIRSCLRLGNDLVAVDRAHGGVAVTMKHDRGHRAPRAVERCACRGPALPHGGECGREVLGDTAGQTRMHADRGVQVRVGRAHNSCGRPTRREPGHIDALRINGVIAHDLAREAREDRRLTVIALLIAWLEPVPALAMIGRHGLSWV